MHKYIGLCEKYSEIRRQVELLTDNMANTSTLPPIEKLKGRENYSTWKFAMKAYLQHEDLWDTVEVPAGEAISQDARKITRAHSKIILSLDPLNYVHVQDTQTAKDAWDKLNSAFEDSGLTRRVGLLRTLITTQLTNCESVNDYVNTVITTAHKLNGIGFKISDEWIGTLLLAGLPNEYKPMIMGLENSGTPITGDAIKTKLLQDVKWEKGSRSPTDDKAFYSKSSNRQFRNKQAKGKSLRCFECNKQGHRAADCRQRKEKQVNANNCEVSDLRAFVALQSGDATSQEDWLIDSGASAHMTKNRHWFKELNPPGPKKEIVVANNERLPVEGIGDIILKVGHNATTENVMAKNVLYVPGISSNLLSVSQIAKRGNKVIFEGPECQILDKNNKLIASGSAMNDTYKLNSAEERIPRTATLVDENIWHRRLGHMNRKFMQDLRNHAATGVNFRDDKKGVCITCTKGKQTKLPYESQNKRAKGILDLIHTDLCGPMENKSIGGAKYMITFMDDHSRKVFVYFLATKDQVADTFLEFKAFVEKQTGRHIRCLRSDNGTEYVNRKMEDIMRNAGIRHQTTIPYNPQQNGTAERMNRTLVEKAKCMLLDANLQTTFWAEAVATSAYLVNRAPNQRLDGCTPEEIWTNQKPDLSHLRIFGCKALVHIPSELRKKWDAKSKECILLGYCADSKGYRLWDPTSRKVIRSRDVTFLETTHTSEKEEPSEAVMMLPLVDSIDIEASEENDTELKNETTDVEESDEELADQTVNPLVLRRSRRPHKPRNLDDYVVYSATVQSDDPVTYSEAVDRPDGTKWMDAMTCELQSLIKNKTWTLQNLPAGKKAIECKWVYKTKVNATDESIRYKARLVAKGYAQKRGLDYEETYAPVVRYTSIRLLFALAAKMDLDIEHLDVVTAFLHGELKEEIYLAQPEGFEQPGNENKVCKLNKAIYGLKQGSRAWNEKLDKTLTRLGLTRCKYDQCVYYHMYEDSLIIIAVYVDDLLMFTNSTRLKTRLKQELMKEYEMKDLGEAKTCLGIQITRDREQGKIWLNQSKYIADILQRFGMTNCNPARTPLEPGLRLNKDMSPKTQGERDEMTKHPYQSAVGSIMYACQGTRPDLAHAVSMVSRFNQDPGKAHWVAVKRILRYLKGTIDYKLEFSKDKNLDIEGFCDADWANDPDERHSTTGYIFTLQGGAISWNSKRQPSVALSTTEAEYMALSSATQEALWLRGLASEIGLKTEHPTLIHCDNRSAIQLSETANYSARTKHIDTRHHFLREKITEGKIKLLHLPSVEMPADMLTKAVTGTKLNQCSSLLGLSI